MGLFLLLVFFGMTRRDHVALYGRNGKEDLVCF